MRMLRRSARLAAAAEADEAGAALASLPLALILRIFLALPADSRARAACVCRAWRDMLEDSAMWSRLDLSLNCGVNEELLDRGEPLLRGAAARANGRLVYLDISGISDVPPGVATAVVADNADSLRELYLTPPERECEDQAEYKDPGVLASLLAAAPLLQVLRANLWCSWDDVHVLRAAPLQLRDLTVFFDEANMPLGGIDRVGPVAAALVNVSQRPRPPLHCWQIYGADTQQAAVMNALADAVLAQQVNALCFCRFSPPAAAPLARLLRAGKFTCFEWMASRGGAPLLDAAGSVLVADALRANTTLAALDLHETGLFRDTRAAETVLRALIGHPSVERLVLKDADEGAEDLNWLGTALGALVAADAPALSYLYLGNVKLDDDGLAPVVDALPRNRHLRALALPEVTISEKFAREHLLPAVRANTSLWSLHCGLAAMEARQLVRNRRLDELSRGQHDDGAHIPSDPDELESWCPWSRARDS
jgi:hypothetical protein